MSVVNELWVIMLNTNKMEEEKDAEDIHDL